MKESALRRKTVLLVEDENEVREIIQLILRSRGVEVVSASSPDEAIKLAESRNGAIDLIISDIVMPGMNGPTLVRKLGYLQPGVPVLYMSGYPERDFEQLCAADNVGFLSKPFLPDELVEQAETLVAGAVAQG